MTTTRDRLVDAERLLADPSHTDHQAATDRLIADLKQEAPATDAGASA